MRHLMLDQVRQIIRKMTLLPCHLQNYLAFRADIFSFLKGQRFTLPYPFAAEYAKQCHLVVKMTRLSQDNSEDNNRWLAIHFPTESSLGRILLDVSVGYLPRSADRLCHG
jgi:hypothetical protein